MGLLRDGNPLITDAYMSFTGVVTGDGSAVMSESLGNNVTLMLHSPGATSASFSPVSSLSVLKDQNDFSGSTGSAESSLLVNAFSVVPAPPIGHGVTVLLAGGAFFGAQLWGRWRRRSPAMMPRSA